MRSSRFRLVHEESRTPTYDARRPGRPPLLSCREEGTVWGVKSSARLRGAGARLCHLTSSSNTATRYLQVLECEFSDGR